ncbi:MAG: DUF814 domain-containing protein [Microscillaceae bacterium]|nr:DUF814 domain-containing protein [Microscillaceae bacterium]
MQDNYYFLKPLSQALAAHLGVRWQLGYPEAFRCLPPTIEKEPLRLLTCFSQNKDELILGFGNAEEDFYIRANLEVQFSCLSFPAEFARARRNSIDLFTGLLDVEVERVVQFENERSFALVFPGAQLLLFKMHGRRANIIWFIEEQFQIAFHKKLENDRQLRLTALNRPIRQDFEAFVASSGDWKGMFPTFDREVKDFLQKKIDPSASLEAQWQVLEPVLAALEQPSYYVKSTPVGPSLSLLSPNYWEDERASYEWFTQPIEAINAFFSAFGRYFYLQEEKQTALKNLQRRYQQNAAYIEKNFERLVHLEDSAYNAQNAHLLMAHLQIIPPGATTVSLPDFYQEGEAVRTIKLKKDASPQKNAEIYYRKAKNEKIEVQTLERNLARKEAEMEEIRGHLAALEKIDSLRALREYLKKHRLGQMKKAETQELSLFKKFSYQGWDIWVGKNAKNNDLLTQQYAKKDDLWLHAKDVSGSHVVIKHQAGREFPIEIIEKAASLAAYYSKRSQDTLCPVLYTPRKFVRKTKDLAPGQVIVEKEKVIIVSPERF